MLNKIIDLMKQKTLIVPMLLLNNYRSLNITDSELIVIMYLMNYDDSFNPKFIASELGFSLNELMEAISNLTDKGLVKIEIINKKVKDERINLDGLYNKLGFIIINDEKEVTSNVYSVVEKEFGRTLSPVEYEIIKNWLNDFGEELIVLGLKEAVFNGVLNLRYIDRILHEWQKKGIKCEKDVLNDRKKFNEKKPTKKIMDYDWLNERDN